MGAGQSTAKEANGARQGVGQNQGPIQEQNQRQNLVHIGGRRKKRNTKRRNARRKSVRR
jgi:hypothetical protein